MVTGFPSPVLQRTTSPEQEALEKRDVNTARPTNFHRRFCGSIQYSIFVHFAEKTNNKHITRILRAFLTKSCKTCPGLDNDFQKSPSKIQQRCTCTHTHTHTHTHTLQTSRSHSLTNTPYRHTTSFSYPPTHTHLRTHTYRLVTATWKLRPGFESRPGVTRSHDRKWACLKTVRQQQEAEVGHVCRCSCAESCTCALGARGEIFVFLPSGNQKCSGFGGVSLLLKREFREKCVLPMNEIPRAHSTQEQPQSLFYFFFW